MTPEEFEYIVDSQLNVCRDLLIVKAREYSTDSDRLHNFKVAGVLQDISPAQALRGMMAKHTVSVFDMLNSGNTFSLEQWGEKITDHINYLLLLMAILCEDDVDTTNVYEDDVDTTNVYEDGYIQEVLKRADQAVIESLFKDLFSNIFTNLMNNEDDNA